MVIEKTESNIGHSSPLKEGENYGKKAIDVAYLALLNVYPKLERDYNPLIAGTLNSIHFEDESLIMKLGSADKYEKAILAFKLGSWAAEQVLQLIPENINLSNNGNHVMWKELMRKNLMSEGLTAIDSPDTKIIARGAELIARSPKTSIDNSPKIGTELNEGIVDILMEPVLIKYSTMLEPNLVKYRPAFTDKKHNAGKILRNLDEADLHTNKGKLLEVFLSSTIPGHIVSSRAIPYFSYPR